MKDIVARLSSDVQKGNDLIGKDHDQVARIFSSWISINRVTLPTDLRPDSNSDFFNVENIQNQLKDETWKDTIGDYSLIAVGLLGLARVYHVDFNTIIRKNAKLFKPQAVEEILKPVRNLYKNLPEATRVHETIHGNAIDWVLELAQDKGLTEELLDQKDVALETYDQAVLYWIEASHEKGPHLKDKDQYAAALYSGLAVVQMRKGRLIGNQSLINQALDLQLLANEVMPNSGRTQSLGRTACISAIANWKQFPELQLAKRWKNFTAGLRLAYGKAS